MLGEGRLLMNMLKAGFCRANIDPPLGIAIRGYYKKRYASAILDSLYVNVAAFSVKSDMAEKNVWNPDTGEYDAQAMKENAPESIVLVAGIDNCGIDAEQCTEYRRYMEACTGVPAERIILHSTHTHTAPYTKNDGRFDADASKIEFYGSLVKTRLADAAAAAIADLKPARMGYIVGQAPDRVAYIRRYKMKDGTTWTCPPIEDANIDHPIGTLDQRVNMLRFDREGGDTLVIMNYGLHADCLNLDQVSPDWPGWMAKTFETAVPGTKVMFLNGAEGDVGSTHVYPEGGDMNDTFISFDNEMKSPGMARFVGRALAGTLLQVYDKAEYVDVDTLDIMTRVIRVPANKARPEDLPLARKYKALHDAGHDDQIPYTAMELTTVVAEATRMLNLENGPDQFELALTGLRLGPVVFAGIPGEPFTQIGRSIKEAPGYKMILPVCLCNGTQGYFPMKEAFDEGGYEARSSRYKGGVAETIIEESKVMLEELLKKSADR